MLYLTSNSQMEIDWFNLTVLAINNARDREQFDEPAAGAVTRKIDSDVSQRLWLICHDLEWGERGRNNFKCLQPVRWYPCDVPLTTGSLKVQSARHSLAATAWQRSRCSRARPKRRTGVKKKRLYTRMMLLTRACFTFQSLLLQRWAKRQPAADRDHRAHLSEVEKKILPDNRIINSGIGVAFARREEPIEETTN